MDMAAFLSLNLDHIVNGVFIWNSSSIGQMVSEKNIFKYIDDGKPI